MVKIYFPWLLRPISLTLTSLYNNPMLCCEICSELAAISVDVHCLPFHPTVSFET